MLNMQRTLMPVILPVRSYVDASASCPDPQSLEYIVPIADGDPGYGYDLFFCLRI